MAKTLITLMAFVAFLGFSAAQLRCPEGACASATCDNSVLENCEGRLVMNYLQCGCCPACIKQIPEGGDCSYLLIMDIEHTKECIHGTSCDFETRTCKKKLNPCDEETARKKKLLEEAAVNPFGFCFPKCTADGFYEPTQCCENACRCVTADGTTISGFNGTLAQMKDMTCKCARDKAEKETAPMMGAVSRQCDSLGNYKSRQCREGGCSCIDRNGEKIPGYTAYFSQATKMTCDCARRNSDQVQLGMNCAPHKCDALGNFITKPTTTC